ncbi:MAG: hypothetical protein HY361_04595 [Candidatus Aenigmarchaeota archaeon]|nr:hypothetical protein [Candidatus Aenigmarchaeota archaeon]
MPYTRNLSPRVRKEVELILEQQDVAPTDSRIVIMRHTGIFDFDCSDPEAERYERITKYESIDGYRDRWLSERQYKRLGKPREIVLDTSNIPYRIRALDGKTWLSIG